MPRCAVSFCKAKKSPYHPFPKNDQQLFDIWKGCVCNFRFSILTDEEISKQYVVCDDHFVDSCKIPGTNSLKKYSIPTLHVSGFKTNSNLNTAYNLYIEKQEKDPINQSVKNITLDHNYVDKILIDHNARIGNEDLDNCTFINLNPEAKSDSITKIWIEQNLHSVVQDSSPLNLHDSLSNNIESNHDEQNQDINDLLEDNNDVLEQEIISMQNITDPIIIEEIKKELDPDLLIIEEVKEEPKPYPVTKLNTKCFAPGCNNKYGSFHKFPANTALCKRWTEALGITKKIKNYMKICSAHFKNTDYFTKFVNNGNSRKLLKRTAIPFRNKKEKLQQEKIFCAANNCFNNNIDHKKICFFPFPADETISRIWANKADREDLLWKLKSKENKSYLCINHFDKVYLKRGSTTELRSDITIIPTVFNNSDCLSKKPVDLYSNIFIQINEPDNRSINKAPHDKKNICLNTLQTYTNDPDVSKITFDEKNHKSSVNFDYGEMNYSYTLYEDFVSNPGVLNLKPETTDLLFKKDYCRLCAKLCSVAALISIFDKTGNFTMYGKMLEVCLPGKINADDNLPHWMCSNCEYKLDVCCSSIKAFIDADNQLRKIFNVDCIEADREDISNIDNTKFIYEGQSNLKPKSNDEKKINNHILPNMPPEINKIIEENQIEENNKYQCLNCDQLYNSKKELIDHSLAAHNPDRLKYNIVCKVVSSDAKSIVTGKKSASNSKVKCSKLRYECVICSSLHEKKDSLIKHSLLYHSGNNRKIVCRVVRINNLKNNHLTCLYCKEEFGNINTYRKHMKQHLKLNCEQCGKQFTRMYRLLAHVKLHNMKSVSCSKCPQMFENKCELLKHQVMHKEEFNNSVKLLKHKKKNERSLCNVCGKLFSSSTLLNYHLEKHSDLRLHKCSICSKAFSSILSLKQHKKIHTSEKECICQICGKQFGYLSVLRSHMYSHSTHKPYICELCGAGFRRRNTLNKHLTSHEKIKENLYICKICQLEFNSRMMYMSHKKQHTNEKKTFTCDICSKRFLTKFQVIIHRRIHTGETPYDCEQCGKSFRSRALVKQHRLIHMNVFPHQCNYCDCSKKFRRLQSLIVHRRTHTGEKPYPCPVCGRSFASRSDMNKHKRNLHHNQLQFDTNKLTTDL